jgi:tetratricopeptide (TPR) repeat protein
MRVSWWTKVMLVRGLPVPLGCVCGFLLPRGVAAAQTVALGPTLPIGTDTAGGNCGQADCTYFTNASAAFNALAPADGRITSWSVELFSGTAQLVIIKAGSGNSHSIVAESAEVTEPCVINLNNGDCLPPANAFYTFRPTSRSPRASFIGIRSIQPANCGTDTPLDCTIVGNVPIGNPQGNGGMVEEFGARGLQAASLSSLAIAYAQLGERERAIAAGRDGLRIAQGTGSAEYIVRAYIGSQAIDDAGLLEEALAMGIEGIAVADRLGMGRGAGDQLRIQAAWRLQRLGRLPEAEHVIQPALENATAPFNVAGSQLLAGRLAVERGELEFAERLLEPAWALMQRTGGFQLIGPAITGLVLLEIRRGELERARERAREGLGLVAAARAT